MTDLTVGSQIEGLRFDELVGRGGSSTVYRATDLATGADRAAKVLIAPDESSVRRLQREASVLAGIHHPDIVTFRGLCFTDRDAVLITDWVDGETLLQRLRRLGPISPEDACNVLSALAEPLDYLHEVGYVHRDISPANIIAEPTGYLTIIDLGIGHHVQATTLTNDDMLAGTPKYLAPEIIRGDAATHRSDQYSVGVMIHELLTGHSPFPASDELATALHHQLATEPVPLDEARPDVPPALADAILRSLEKEPEERFDSLEELATAARLPSPKRTRRKPMGAGSRSRSRLVKMGAVVAIPALALGAYLAVNAADSGTSAGFDESGSQPTLTTTTAGSQPSGSTAAGANSGPVRVPTPTVDVWSVGTARSLGCNLLAGVGFEEGTIPIDYYGNPPDNQQIVPDVGFGGSSALEVGKPNLFGQYGERVPVEVGRTYVFQGWFQRVGPMESTHLAITFLDANFQGLADGPETPIPDGDARFVTSEPTTAPEGASYAVPYLFKDGSAGVLLADELVFGEAATCGPQIEQIVE